MNVIDLLKTEHEVITGLLQRVKAAHEEERPSLLRRIKSEVSLHAHIEEAIFYPILLVEGDGKLIDIVLDGIEGHRQVRSLLREVDYASNNRSRFEPQLRRLIENVEHRVEEEREIFTLVEHQLDPTLLEDMGAAMEAEKLMFIQSMPAEANN